MINEKDYFQEKVEIKPEIIENDFGLKIKKVNNGTLGNMWRGIFGFERLRQNNSSILKEYMAFVISREPVISTNGIAISELRYDDVFFRGVQKIPRSKVTVFPVIKNIDYINVENDLIAEWMDMGGLKRL